MRYTHGKQVKSSTMTSQYRYPSLEIGVIGPLTSACTNSKGHVVRVSPDALKGSFFIFAMVQGSQNAEVPVKVLIPCNWPFLTILSIQSIEIWPSHLWSVFTSIVGCADGPSPGEALF